MFLCVAQQNNPAVLKYVTLQKDFSHPSLVIYFFCNCAYKTKTGTAKLK
jgi:hypothetical protein